jgi:hypothetical protein
MIAIDRRAVLRDFLPGVLVATGAGAVGLTLTLEAASSMPFAADNMINAIKAEGLVQKAQAEPAPSTRPAGGAPSSPRRRRVCNWRRGRRVCVWRWV